MRTSVLITLFVCTFFSAFSQTISPSGTVNLCPGDTRVITITGFSGTFRWVKDGVVIPGQTNNTYTITSAGRYQAVLIDGTNIDTLGPVNAVDRPNPPAAFTFNQGNTCSNSPISFAFTGSPSGLDFLWNFDDPTSGSANASIIHSPLHTFEGTPGNGSQSFSVRLTTTNSFGCSASSVQTITTRQTPGTQLIGNNPTTYGGFQYFTECGATSATFSFLNNSSTQATNTTYQIKWGDGTPDFNGASLTTIDHDYPLGNFTLLFIINGQNGCRDTGVYKIFVGSNPAIGFANPGSSSICSGTPLTFQVSSFINNPPATIYTVTFNDGTPPITYNHPAPDSVTHQFNVTSCGTSGGTFANSFSATIEASNPCSRSVVTVVPIYVSEKPDPDFTISPHDTVCVNNTVTLNNTGGGASNNNNGTCTPGKSVWSISPATGWTVTSGSLGTDLNSPNTNFWTSGTDVLGLNFTAPGSYAIKLKTGNSNCGKDSIVKIICVNPLPAGTFTLSETNGCGPLDVSTTTSINSPLCGTYRYQWSVSYSPTSGCVPATSQFNYINSTSVSSAQPSFRFINPGIYTVAPTLIGPGGLCQVQLPSQTITVKSKPVVSFSAFPPNLCQGQAFTPSASAVCYVDGSSTYAWTFPGGAPGTSSNPNPGPVTFNNGGAQTITLAVTNSCGTTTETQNISVSPTPSFTTPANKTVCAGENVALSNLSATPAAASVSWTNSNSSIGLAASGTGNIPAFTATNTGSSPVTATITVTATLNGCVNTDTYTITVNPRPQAPAAANVAYCLNETATALSATATAGNTLLWYTTSSGGTGAASAPTPATTTAGSTNYYVSQVNTASGCESARTIVTVTVNPIPSIGGVTPVNPTLCGTANGGFNITGLSANTSYNVQYTSSAGVQNVTLTSSGSGVIAVTNLAAGNYSDISVSLAGCRSNILGPVSLTPPSAPAAPTAGNSGPVCGGQTLNLTASAVAGATYAWTGPGGFTSSDQNPTRPNALPAYSGTYSVTVTVSGCTSPAASTTVVVNPTPVITSVSSNTPVCEGQSISLQSSTSFAGALTYAWTGPAGFTSADEDPVRANAALAHSGNYTLVITATTGSCASAVSTTAVVVNEQPEITGITAVQPNLCNSATGSITIAGLTTGNAYTIRYTKGGVAQAPLTLTATAPGIVTIPTLTAGTYAGFTVEINGCSDTDPQTIVLADPNPPNAPTIVPFSTLCSGQTLTLSASTSSPGTASYQWNGPAGFSSTQQNPTITNISTTQAGSYSVVAIIDGCTSPSTSVTVVVDSTPTAPVIISNSPVCSGQSINLSATTTFAGVITYAWTGPGGFNSADPTPSIPNASSANGGNYQLIITAQQGGCVSPSATANVTVNITPNITGSSSANPTQCNTPTGSITLSGLIAASSYVVNYTTSLGPVSTNITANGAGEVIISGLTAGTYGNVYVQLNNCSSNTVGPFNLSDPNPPAAPTVSSNSPICIGQDIQLQVSTSEPGVPTFSWTGPDGFVSSSTNPLITNATTANGGTYQVTVTINSCTSPAASTVVVVNQLAAGPGVVSPVEYCINTPAIALTATPAAGSPLTWYTTATGGTGSATAPVPSTTTAGTTNYYVSQTNSFGCEGAREEISVIVHPDARAVINPVDTIGCPAFNITGSNINLQTFPAQNGIYEWYADNVLIGTGTTFPGYTIANENDSVTIKLKTISPFGCRADSVSQKFYTYKLPHPSFELIDTVGCGPLDVQVLNTTPDISLFTYFWDFGNGQTSTAEQPGTITFQPNPQSGDTIYTVRQQIFSICDTITVTHTLRVKSKPKALFSPSRTTGCSPMLVNFVNTTRGFGTNFKWDFGDGATLATNNTNDVQHTYNSGLVDTFTVKLIAENECGSDTAQFDLVIAPNNINLNFNMNGPDAFGCAPHVVPFINNTVGASIYNWDFGDGNVLSTTRGVDTVTHAFINPGTYTVSMTAVNSCTDTTATRIIEVFPRPQASFTKDRDNVCIGQQVQFTNTSGSATSYLWNFGDGRTSTLVSPAHTYTASGTYTVKLFIFRLNAPGNICSDSTEQIVTVSSELPGSFTMSDSTSTCVPLTVTFVNQNRPSVSAVWDFGDGNTGAGDSISHTYQFAGIYTVSLIVRDAGGCTYRSSRQVRVNGTSGTFSYAGGFVCHPDQTRFEATGLNIDSLVWNFGDGTIMTTNQRVVFHQYNDPGVYIPSVTLKNNAGCQYPVAGIDTIKVDKIISGFTVQLQKSCGVTKVVFTDTSSVFFGKQLVSWNFGDGNTGSGVSVSHDYFATGDYEIEMIVVGNSGCRDTVRTIVPIHVNNIPDVTIVADTERCTRENVLFMAAIASADSVNHIQWRINNGATGSGEQFTYSFASPGNYTVRLITGTVNGCFDTAFHNITIRQSPVITASNNQRICLGNSVPLTATGALSYQWSPVEGLSCTSCATPLASPVVTTPYVVTGTNAVGCTSTDTVVVTVIQPFSMSVSPSDSICIGQSANLMASGASTYTWTPSITLNSGTISNPVATPTATTTYRVVGHDGFNCFSDTAFVVVGVGQYPTVRLGPDVTLSTGTELPLNTTVTNGPIRDWVWTPSEDLSCDDCPLPIATIRNTGEFRVLVRTHYGCEARDTIKVKAFCHDAQVFIPNAFTPDNDGINDILMVRGTGIVSVKSFRIFNRWGEVVFERSSFPPNNPAYGWDGKVRGKVGGPDVYVYTAEVICTNGTPFFYKGNVSIIK